MANRIGYWKRLGSALLGRDPSSGLDRDGSDQRADLEAHVASLKLDLNERDQQIEEMRKEYALLQAASQRAGEGAGDAELEKLFKRIVGTLANFSALAACSESGQDVEAADLITLFRGVERELGKAGLEPIGHVGEQTMFDVAAHQRMSGGAVHQDTPVAVQLPGYRLGERVLMKAMVSAADDVTP